MNIISFGILGLREVTGNPKGIAIVTQPLSAIMNEKMKNKDVKTAFLSMTGKLKNEEGQDDAELDCIENDVLEGVYPVVIGHPESWGSRRGQRLLMEMRKQNMILLVGRVIKYLYEKLEALLITVLELAILDHYFFFF